MLEQTCAAAVVRHYHEFLRRFALHKLAGAREASLLAAWIGLGITGGRLPLVKPARTEAATCSPRAQNRLDEADYLLGYAIAYDFIALTK